MLTNALIRCIRNDNAAGLAFELVRADMGLWVMELDFHFSDSWASQIESIADQLEGHRVLLASLGEGSSDYALHLAAETDAPHPLRIPVRLARLASECGFEIEIYAQLPRSQGKASG
jgi:hypothetical protein